MSELVPMHGSYNDYLHREHKIILNDVNRSYDHIAPDKVVHSGGLIREIRVDIWYDGYLTMMANPDLDELVVHYIKSVDSYKDIYMLYRHGGEIWKRQILGRKVVLQRKF